MKTFEQFINEKLNIRSKMTPKSEEEIRSNLDKLDPKDKINLIYNSQAKEMFSNKELMEFWNQIPDKYKFDLILDLHETDLFPEEIKKYLADKSPSVKFEIVFKYGLHKLFTKEEIKELWEQLNSVEIFRNLINYRVKNLFSIEELKKIHKKSPSIAGINYFKDNKLDLFSEKEMEDILKRLSTRDKMTKACELGLTWLIKDAIEEGFDIKEKNKFFSFLSTATYFNHINIVKILLEEGATVEEEKFRPIKSAKEKGYTDILELLEKSIKENENI